MIFTILFCQEQQTTMGSKIKPELEKTTNQDYTMNNFEYQNHQEEYVEANEDWGSF